MTARRKAAETRAERVIRFIEEFLVVPEGALVGQPVKLLPWQRDLIAEIYNNPTRTAIISVARKNGKTALISMLLLAHLIGPEARPNGQIYSAAQSRDQASIVFGYAAKMVRMSNELEPLVRVTDSGKRLFAPRTGVTYRALSADATTAYGLSPILAIHDELGQVRGPRSELFDALETAMGAQANPLSVILSTQAPTDADLLSVLIDDALAKHDPQTRVFLYAADRDDDPWSEATWRKANPALGVFNNLSEMRRQAEAAKRLPSFEAAFRNLHLNQRVAAENHLFSPSIWKLNGGRPDMSAFEDFQVFCGVDLSSRLDLTAAVFVCRDDKGIVHVLPRFWAPADGLRDRALRDRAPYDTWRDQGFLTATPGKTVDYGYVARELADFSRRFSLQKVCFDRWRIHDLGRELANIGAELPLEPFGQGYRDMAPAIDQLENLAVEGKLRHGMNPVLTWCTTNAVVSADAAGNRKLDKSRASGRIDGIVALAMAVAAMGKPGVEEAPEYQMMFV